MIRTCLQALLSHWWRNPLQFFAFIAGLGLATALWSGVQAINAEARASYDAAATTLGEGQFDQLVPRVGNTIPLREYVNLRRAGWQVSPVSEAEFHGVRLVGIDPLTWPTGLAAAAAIQSDSDSRAALFANAETVAGLPEDLNIEVSADIAPGLVVGDISEVQRLLQRDSLTRLVILDEQPMVRSALEDVAPELRRLASNQTADIAQLTNSFHLNLTAFGLLSFVVGLFIVHSTIGLAFEQRRGMVRTLRSLGVTLHVLIGIMAVEMLALALLGAILGLILGYLIAAMLLPDVAATLQGLYGAQVSGTLHFRAEWWLSGFALAFLGTFFAFVVRAWQIARMPLLASVRPRAWVLASGKRLRLQCYLALCLLVVSGLLAITVQGLFGGFALLGLMLLGAALLFPVLADWVILIFENRSRSHFWQWFWADTRQQLPGLSLALMALLLAVSANIGVATMVSSFRLTFIGFLDQRLAPELYVQVDSAEQSTQLEAFLASRDIETLPLLRTPALIAEQPVRLLGMRVGRTYRESWVFLDQIPGVWDVVAQGRASVVNEQFAHRSGLWVGDPIVIAPDVELPIGAVVGDYGNPNAHVMISETVMKRLHPDIYPAQFGLRVENPEQMAEDIANQVGVPASAIIDQSRLKSMSLETFERTFLVTAALNVLTLGVAGFAILMTLLTLADIRLPQLAPVWAMGFTRRRLGYLELLRALALAALVFLFAVPVGLALAWILLSIVNVLAFGWKLPLFIFPVEYAQLGLYSLAAAFLAATWPVFRLVRTPPSRLLKVFANER